MEIIDNNKILSRKDALLEGKIRYYTGKPCKHGHLSERYVKTMICCECSYLHGKKFYKENPESIKRVKKKSYELHKDSHKDRNTKWRKENREKDNQHKKNWKLRNKEKYSKMVSEYDKKRRADPIKRISRNLSKAIWQSLKGKKGGLTWLSYVDFTIEELSIHLESKFKPEMTWDNYGSYWHVDHIRPLSWFNLETDFKQAWCLENLQPLEAELNLSKNNRYEG